MNPVIVRTRNGWYLLAGAAALGLGVAAWARVGLLNLPSPPAGVTAHSAGLAGLDELRRLDDFVRFGAPAPASLAAAVRPAADAVREGLSLLPADVPAALERMRAGLRLAPDNIVLANAYRIAVFGLKREFLAASHRSAAPTPEFPDYLRDEPIAFLGLLAREHPSREADLQLALAWVDQMLLFPALEIKAPSSVEAVRILSRTLAAHPGYVPALFARGLNHLHRPARLVWPETASTPRDAAARDVGLCIAIGRRLGGASPRLEATLCLALGDSYVKAGRFETARSWWQVARNLCRDADLADATGRRFSWPDESILDQLEIELDRGRSDLDRPMTDLAMMWR